MKTSSAIDRDGPTLNTGPFSRVPSWLLLLGFWSAVALMIATLSHSRMLAVERPSQYIKWLIESLLIWNFWALATPLVIKLGGRLYVQRGHWMREGALLLGTAVLTGMLFISYQVFMSMVVMGESLQTYSSVVVGQFAWLGPYSLLIFGGLVALGYAREFRRRWQENELTVRDLESQLTRAQLDALASQLQPHFFFNTLNAISVLIRKGDAEQAQAMLGRLSELLRYTLSTGNRPTVPLGEEVQFVRGYVEIEMARFGERLRCDISVPSACEVAPVPPLILQPIVENAIRHGLADRLEGGAVSVIVRREDSQLTILIEDNGRGFAAGGSGSAGEGLGLGNTRARLERMYGGLARLDIRQRAEGGTAVEISIPLAEAGV